MYQIQPYDIVTTRTITSFVIDRIELTLFKRAVITIVMYDSANIPVDVRNIELSGSDYEQWNNDDNYVVQYVCNKLGMLLPTVEEPVVEPVLEPVTVVEPVTVEKPVPVKEPVTVEEPVTVVEPVVEIPVQVEEPVPSEEPATTN